jgi:hypothetical protein
MAVKHKNLFLYLTLACFVGIILIFIIDGYMGVYDNLFVTTGEREYDVGVDGEEWRSSVSVEWGNKAFFRYEVDNRRFSGYTADVEVSLWRQQQKIDDLVVQPMSLGSFAKEDLEWVLDSVELHPEHMPAGQDYEFTLVISRGEIERRVITRIRGVSSLPEPLPAP